MLTPDSPKAQLLSAARALLRYQGHLGYRGGQTALREQRDLDAGPARISQIRTPAEADLRADSPQNHDHDKGVSQDLGEQGRQSLRATPDRQSKSGISPNTAMSTAMSGELLKIRQDLGECQRCGLHSGRTHLVFGAGSPQARLMLVGEGPGRDEDLQGEPFVGKSGQLLDKILGAMGLSRSDVYITNIIKCRPPRNRDPEPGEVEICSPFLWRQIEAIQPDVIVTLGRHAAHSLLNISTPITRLRGQWQQVRGVPVMPTFHPAYLLRNPKEKAAVWEDMKNVMQKLQLSSEHFSG
ncbi:uracil-DNA glycosylase [Myxococcota bacterium]|nr:uracil-DNA glycosylase [Myxococcota bacterium]